MNVPTPMWITVLLFVWIALINVYLTSRDYK